MPRTVKPQELKLAKQVVDMFDGELNLKDYKDEIQEELRKIIDARMAGEEYVAARSRGAADQRRRPDGRAREEPRRGERVEEEAGEGGADGEEDWRRRSPKGARVIGRSSLGVVGREL